MKKIYSAYFEMRKLKHNYKEKQSAARKHGHTNSADEYGERAAVVDECMNILVDECNLTFNQ